MDAQMDLIGRLQHRAMLYLWEHGSASVKTVHEYLNAHSTRQLAYTTILTVLRNLHRRGLLTREQKSRFHVYTAACTREEFQQKVLQIVCEDFFDNDRAKMSQMLNAAAVAS